jgi:hypothetical protein
MTYFTIYNGAMNTCSAVSKIRGNLVQPVHFHLQKLRKLPLSRTTTNRPNHTKNQEHRRVLLAF